ncbi:MAG: hypothetical protein Q7V20_08290 [Aquabacterium sp.]|uniref:hypothetical protein n=1 Tax=Aquabacterium sp. TaxID=1872578 RepID=UPI0027267A58|nr:hypothetical protein [Aquabacterium sp.]MDO9003433.1 hypothetical protein [Aquabacterium sp.]
MNTPETDRPLSKPVSSAGPEIGAPVEKVYETGAAMAGVRHDNKAVHKLADAIFLNDMKFISLDDDDKTGGDYRAGA